MTTPHNTLATKLAGTVDYPFYEPRDPDNLPVIAVTREAWESYAKEPDAVIELGGGEPRRRVAWVLLLRGGGVVMSEWKPGDVAVDMAGRRFMRGESNWWGPKRAAAAALRSDQEVGDIRPLVVIDPATLQRPIKGGDPHYDAAELARTLRLLANHDSGGPYTYRAEIVRELADKIAPVEPPKPDEPTGWLAAVMDADGNRWCLHGGPVEPRLEWYSPDLNARRTYADITAVRVLSEGVQS